mmetsp:Transcript_1073/g.4451  ORF Transcript_1073/g.4451 Transcript_1073/m.4451 type:complete len:230 (+) Transcript_1073:3400-4089(+)
MHHEAHDGLDLRWHCRQLVLHQRDLPRRRRVPRGRRASHPPLRGEPLRGRTRGGLRGVPLPSLLRGVLGIALDDRIQGLVQVHHDAVAVEPSDPIVGAALQVLGHQGKLRMLHVHALIRQWMQPVHMEAVAVALCVEYSVLRRQRLELQRMVRGVGADRDDADAQAGLPEVRRHLRKLRDPPSPVLGQPSAECPDFVDQVVRSGEPLPGRLARHSVRVPKGEHPNERQL